MSTRCGVPISSWHSTASFVGAERSDRVMVAGDERERAAGEHRGRDPKRFCASTRQQSTSVHGRHSAGGHHRPVLLGQSLVNQRARTDLDESTLDPSVRPWTPRSFTDALHDEQHRFATTVARVVADPGHAASVDVARPSSIGMRVPLADVVVTPIGRVMQPIHFGLRVVAISSKAAARMHSVRARPHNCRHHCATVAISVTNENAAGFVRRCTLGLPPQRLLDVSAQHQRRQWRDILSGHRRLHAPPHAPPSHVTVS